MEKSLSTKKSKSKVQPNRHKVASGHCQIVVQKVGYKRHWFYWAPEVPCESSRSNHSANQAACQYCRHTSWTLAIHGLQASFSMTALSNLTPFPWQHDDIPSWRGKAALSSLLVHSKIKGRTPINHPESLSFPGRGPQTSPNGSFPTPRRPFPAYRTKS